MNQCDRILEYMRENGGITQLEAANEIGCYRLSARIFDLKRRGVRIDSETVRGRNRFGDTIVFKRYTLVKEEKK